MRRKRNARKCKRPFNFHKRAFFLLGTTALLRDSRNVDRMMRKNPAMNASAFCSAMYANDTEGDQCDPFKVIATAFILSFSRRFNIDMKI